MFAFFCTCLGGWVVNSCCMHVEAAALLVFQPNFFKTTLRNRGLWGDINLPDNQVPQSHGPLPTNRNQEEVFQPVNHPGRRHPDRRRNLYSMSGLPRDSSNQGEEEQRQREEREQQQRERAEAERQQQQRDQAEAERQQQQRERAEEQQRRERAEAERQEEELRRRNQSDAERQEQARQEAEEQRQREEQARCEEEQRHQREQQEQRREEANQRQQEEETARKEREREEAEQRYREEQEHRREEAERQRQQDSSGGGGEEHFLQQVMQQSGTQTCYAASVCALAARLGLHQHLQAVAASPGSHLLHLAFIRALSALLDSTSPRPTAETVVSRLNLCLDPSGRDERYNLYRQQCASEFVRDILGEAINA